jgi:hypothetical protein
MNAYVIGYRVDNEIYEYYLVVAEDRKAAKKVLVDAGYKADKMIVNVEIPADKPGYVYAASDMG